MNDDAALLCRFVQEGSDAAFTELVQRHVNLVYGAALRRTGGDAHRAADVAQQVFTALARQAARLSRHPALSAWLHAATRNVAVNVMISEQRRKKREAAAAGIESGGGDATAADWEAVRPVLDAAIDELPEVDRAAVVLRFLERRAFADIGALLHISADAARMRTERALDKLYFTAAIRQAQEGLQRVLTQRFGPEFVERMTAAAQKAGAAYQAAHGKAPPSVEAALPYFTTPQEGADFVEFSSAAAALGVKL